MALFLNHHFRRFDDDGNFIAGLQVHFFHAAPGDNAFDFVLADLNHDVSHHATEIHFFHPAAELIACG
jgi:hypothetical protein